MNWAIRISNSHRKLAQMEITNLLPDVKIQWVMPLLAVVSTSKSRIDLCLQYAGSIKLVISNPIELQFSKSHDDQAVIFDLEPLERDNLRPLPSISTFAARFYPVLYEFPKVQTLLIERKVGGKVLQAQPELKVNLSDPDAEFGVIGHEKGAIAGWIYKKLPYSEIAKISPKESPFFGGGAMKPLLSKILVNYLYPFDAVICDPFCGHGGMLRQVSQNNHLAIGFEVTSRIARECKINNEYHGLDHTVEVIMADATKPPMRRKAISQIVTDPPYAIQTTTKGKDREDLVVSWLKTLEINTKVVITLPTNLELANLKDWKVLFEETDYVHRSLTRVARTLVRIK